MNNILTVTEVNRYLKEIISSDPILGDVFVKGEISNFVSHGSGHKYFSLKDENCVIRCVMFKTAASGLKFAPENGMKVIVRGYISIYENSGQYQLYAQDMQPDGIGSLHIAFEQLKKKLQQEGLFDLECKKTLPILPQKIAVVTSPTGAVIRDIVNVLFRRFPNVELILYPAAVQGELAAGQIAHGLNKLNEMGEADVIIVARGGGSIEDLWPFNDELVARSIFNSKIPVISAVGHETDFTIADFVADLRAPTPSAAAELAIQRKEVLRDSVLALQRQLKSLLQNELTAKKNDYRKLAGSVVFRRPLERVVNESQKLDSVNRYLLMGFKNMLERKKSDLGLLAGKLDTLSPLTILGRGYSITVKSIGHNVVKSYKNVKKDEKLDVIVSDGTIKCTVDSAHKK